jgi:leucyl aminopeptidase
MQYQSWTRNLAALEADCIALGVFEEGVADDVAQDTDKRAHGAINKVLARGDFAGRLADTLLLGDIAGIKAPRVLLVGLGAKASFTRRAWRRAVSAAVTAVAATRSKSLALAIDRPTKELDDYTLARAAAELTGAAVYRVNDRKTGKRAKPPGLERVIVGPIRARSERAAARGLAHGAAIARAVRVMRDLANLPANVCTPSYLARAARELAKSHAALQVRVLDEAAIRREKMGCFLAVTQGSVQPPQFIVMQYRGPKSAKAAPIVLVGKGITFDSGGISLKDPPNMDEMKFDMSGAASVIATLGLAADLRLPLHVIGLVPTCENMPDGRAIKPGDVVTSASGQTVEILNTDAEGRLILCDALHYARRFKPATIIDIATLTGACVIALGPHHAGVFSTDQALAREIVEAGARADDRAWQLPLTEEYGEGLKSNFADFANVAGREGGAITAAAFLAKFTKGLQWAHLDIAGTAYLAGAHKGSTGRPVPLLADFLIHRAGGLSARGA